MVSLAGLLGSGLEAASNSLVPAATNALLPAATGAVASAATNMGGAALSGLLGKESPMIGTVQNTTKALWNTADDVESMLDGKYLGTNDNYFSQFNPTSLSLMDYTGRPADQKKVAGIMRAIKNNEDIIPITVMKNADNTMTVIDGHHRLQAFRQSGKMPRLKVVNNKTEGYAYADKYASGKLDEVEQYPLQKTTNTPNHIDLRGVDLSEYAPEFIERANSGAPQEEIIIPPQVQQYLPQVQNAKGESLSEIRARLMAMREARNNLSSDVVRIGSSDVAQIDPTTRPANYDRLVDYMRTDPTARLENAIGARIDSDDFPDKLVRFIEDEGYDVKKNIVDNVQTARRILDEQLLDEMNMEGGHTYRQFLETRSKLEQDNPGKGVGVRAHTISAENGQLYQTDAAKLDREYSDRLGIGRSHTPMADKTLSSDAQGNYIGGGIGVKEGYGNGESGVSTIAHERLHAWQDARLSDYHPDVINAIDDLRSELKQYYHTPAQIKAYRKSGADMAYYSDPKEQEARMLQSYLDNKGYTKTYKVINNEKQEWGDEINPAFDKFFKKFREFSKKGIALPALGLIFGGATAAAGAGANRES